jgi:hypothetical protein
LGWPARRASEGSPPVVPQKSAIGTRSPVRAALARDSGQRRQCPFGVGARDAGPAREFVHQLRVSHRVPLQVSRGAFPGRDSTTGAPEFTLCRQWGADRRARLLAASAFTARQRNHSGSVADSRVHVRSVSRCGRRQIVRRFGRET